MVTLLEERTLLTTPTLITLGDSGVSLSYGQAETFTATVTTNPPSSTIPTGGTVTFSDGSNTLGTPQPLTNGTAELSVTSLVVGNHVVTASYSGTSTFGGSTMAAPPPPDISTLAGGGNPALRQALYTSLSGPYASVVDSAGDLFIADSGDNVIDEVNQSTGAVTIVAGDGTQNYSGDGGPATAAELSSPDGLALDGSGDLFIADTDNNAIREVNLQTGIINTVAGNGTSGYSGDSGQATAATLNFPNSIALDTSGDLFIADTGNNVVREVNLKTGIINTVAGNGTAGYSGDSGQATAAELNGPGAVAADSSGDLFIADTGNNLIREVKLSSGIITTVAGGYNDGNGGYSGDGGQATAAELNFPDGVAYRSGDLFIADADNNVIREVNLGTGIINTVAGNGNAGYSGDGDQATAAELNSPGGVALDSSGDLFIADTYNNVIREVNSSNNTIATVAGGDAMGYSGDGGPASDAGLNFPDGIASDASGDLFITDDGNNVVREINATTGVITTIAGNGTYGYSGDTGQATAAELASPDGVVWSSSGDLFISDSGNDVVREVNLTTGIITTIAGNGTGGYSGDGDQATAAELNAPGGLALDSSGDLFIADSGNNVVREVNLNTGIITTVAGNGTADYSGDGDQATAAELNSPEGVALDNSGDLFIADSSNNAIREVNLKTGIITTIAGDGTADYSGDNGQATAAELNFPNGVAVNTSGDLFVADGDNNVIREVNLKTGIITTVAGNSTAGYSGDGGLATAAELNGPGAIALDSSGDLFVADSGNNVIRELPAPTNGTQTVDVTPASLTVKANNATMVYGAAIPGLSATITGFVNGDGSGVVSGTPDVSTTATPGSDTGTGSSVGSYPIIVTAGTLSAANYTFNFVPASLTVTPALLTVMATSPTNVYGSQFPELDSTITGFVNGDTPGVVSGEPDISTTATSSSNVGKYPITITAGTLGATNYSFKFVNGILTQAPAPLTVTASPNTKPYDGTTSAAAAPTITSGSLAPGDTASFTESYSTQNVGTGLTLTPIGTVSDGNGGKNYDVTFADNTSGAITAMAITVTAAANSKTYDGTTGTAARPTITSGTLASGDTASFTESYSTRNAGTGLTLTPTGSVNDGNGGKNYAVTFADNTSGAITAMAITVTAAANSKTYDGTTSAAAMPTITSGTLASGDTASFTESYSTRNVGTGLTLTPAGSVSDGNGGKNYAVTFVSTTNGAIAPKVLTDSGLSVPSSKVYDGTTTAVVSGAAALQAAETAGSGTTSDGKPYSGDTVSVTGTPAAAYNSKDVATATTVTFGGLSLTGAQAGDYSFTASTQAATITPKALTYGGLSVPSSTVYDGTTTAAVSGTAALQAAETAGSGTTSDGKPYSGDTVSVTGTPAATYNSKDVATATTVTFGGVSVSGSSGGDYMLTTLTQSATITPRTVTASIVGNPTKTYDGKTGAALTSANFNLSGLVGSESFMVTQTVGTYNSKDVATANAVTASLSPGNFTPGPGTLATNYTLPTSASGAATINPHAFTDQIGNDSHSYGGTNHFATDLGTTINTGVNGENLSITYSSPGNTATAGVGTHPITGTLANGTGLTSDYAVTLEPGTLAVSPAALTITASDETTTAGQTLNFGGGSTLFTSSGLQNGETIGSVTLTVSGNGSAATAGSYAITPSAATGGTFSPSDYNITYKTGTLAVAPAPVTVAPAPVTVAPAPVTVVRILVASIKTGKHKTSQVIEIVFSGALNASAAQDLGIYTLGTVPKGKKKSKPVALSGATYNSTTQTVTLATSKKLAPSPGLKLTINAAGLGLSEGNVAATINKSGATFTVL